LKPLLQKHIFDLRPDARLHKSLLKTAPKCKAPIMGRPYYLMPHTFPEI
jgi:hypothetical protein